MKVLGFLHVHEGTVELSLAVVLLSVGRPTNPESASSREALKVQKDLP